MKETRWSVIIVATILAAACLGVLGSWPAVGGAVVGALGPAVLMPVRQDARPFAVALIALALLGGAMADTIDRGAFSTSTFGLALLIGLAVASMFTAIAFRLWIHNTLRRLERSRASR